jgi:hypothetical protein
MFDELLSGLKVAFDVWMVLPSLPIKTSKFINFAFFKSDFQK